jgi:hypothetical protein
MTTTGGSGPLPGSNRSSAEDAAADYRVADWSWLIAGAALVGLLTGALGTAFRVCLQLGERAP